VSALLAVVLHHRVAAEVTTRLARMTVASVTTSAAIALEAALQRIVSAIASETVTAATETRRTATER
jgi:histone H3/H4